MIYNANIFALVSIVSIAQASTNSAEINKLISNLYNEPIGEFTYEDGRGKNEDYWKSYYSNYYCDKIVNLIIEKIKCCPGEPYKFLKRDPRFFPAGYDFTSLKKFKVGKPIIKGRNAEVIVSYTTSDDVTENHCITIYYLTKTEKGWRITDQCLSQPASSKINPRADLVESMNY